MDTNTAPETPQVPVSPISAQSQPKKSLTPEELKAKKEKRRQAAAKRRQFRIEQNRNIHNLLLTVLMILILFLFFLINLVVRDKTFSDAENRNLSQKPTLSVATLTDGSYFSDLDDYATDQFFGRDVWMSGKLQIEKLMGRKEASGVFIGSDHYLLSAPEEPNQEALSRTIAAVNSFAAGNEEIAMRMMLVPDSAMILSDKLPKNAPVRDQLQDIADIQAQLSGSIQFLDAASALAEHSDEYIYYKTDHHWTSLGAYYAFEACSGQMGIANPAGAYDIYTVTDSFEGTLSSKAGSHSTKDTIQVYTAKNQDNYYVSYPDGSEKVCSIYVSSALENKDKYTVFFGGNHSKVEISTVADNERVLLLFKDSYANSFVQFLLPYYEKIIMIDPRYYYDDFNAVLSTENITDVLFLYSADTLVADTSLADVLESVAQDTETVTEGSTDSTDGTDTTGDSSSVVDSAEEGILDSSTESSADSTPESSSDSATDGIE